MLCFGKSGAICIVTVESVCIAGKVLIDDPTLPAFPESAEEAHARINSVLEVVRRWHFLHAITEGMTLQLWVMSNVQEIGNRYEGNILIVAHGEV